MQATVARPVELVGVGIHTAKRAEMKMLPAPANTGIVFRRVDVLDRPNLIKAHFNQVENTQYCTRLSNNHGVSVSTVEHLMAAIFACSIQNAVIEISGPEIPNMDGSSRDFLRGILKSGRIEQEAPIRILKVTKPVMVRLGEATAQLVPSNRSEMEVSISYKDESIGDQWKFLNLANGAIAREIGSCRTFCLASDILAMWKMKVGLGGTLDSVLVFMEGDTLTPGGLRMHDECVGHKMLDAVGDLALSGHVIVGKFIGKRSGHAVTNLLLRRLFADPGAYRIVEATASDVVDLPGIGVKLADVL